MNLLGRDMESSKTIFALQFFGLDGVNLVTRLSAETKKTISSLVREGEDTGYIIDDNFENRNIIAGVLYHDDI